MNSPAMSAIRIRSMNASVGYVKMKRRTGRKHLPQRPHDELEDVLDEERGDRHADAQRQQRADDALPELVQMLQERHLSAFGFVVEPAVGHVSG